MTAADDLGGENRQKNGPPANSGRRPDESAAALRQKPSRTLDFDVAIATRNRPEALALSIPLILGQSRKPRKLIVIDSSDDHAAVARTVAEAVAKAGEGWSGEVVVEHTGRGAAFQRNRGVEHVESEVVFLPDDDSLFHPGTSEAIMRAYELDTEGRIAGVCSADALEPPPGVLTAARYEMISAHKLEGRFLRHRNRLERRIRALSPSLYLGELLMSRAEPLDWFAAENCVLVGNMAGYRMSFRTAVIRANPFDEILKLYSIVEDLDASFAAMRHGALVGARNARIYHHRFPGGRGDPYTLGMMRVLNRSYVVIKHIHDAGLAPADAERVRRLLRQFCRLKVLTLLPRIYRHSNREELRGVVAALDGVRAMLAAPREDLTRIYSEAEAQVLARQARGSS
jgi:glycosyltransferase involved in cell wall biosynthesis